MIEPLIHTNTALLLHSRESTVWGGFVSFSLLNTYPSAWFPWQLILLTYNCLEEASEKRRKSERTQAWDFLRDRHRSQGNWLESVFMTWNPIDINYHQAMAVSQEKKNIRNRMYFRVAGQKEGLPSLSRLPGPPSGRIVPFFHHTAHLCDGCPLLCVLLLKESLAWGFSLSDSSNIETLSSSSSEKELRSKRWQRWIGSMFWTIIGEQHFSLEGSLLSQTNTDNNVQ